MRYHNISQPSSTPGPGLSHFRINPFGLVGPVGPVGLVGLTIKPRHSWDRGAGRDRLPLCKRSNGLIVADGSARFTAFCPVACNFLHASPTQAHKALKIKLDLDLDLPVIHMLSTIHV